MKLLYDRVKIKESIESGGYDERNLAVCKCGQHRLPSKLMFIRFLEQFKDVMGTADIWSEENWDTDMVTIHVEVRYKVPDLTPAEKKNHLPLHPKMLLEAITQLPEKSRSGDVYREYVRLAAERNLAPLTRRRISSLITELAEQGFIKYRLISSGRGGRTRFITLIGGPKNVGK